MRFLTRTAVATAITLTLSMTLISPASAARLIRYEGQTSAPTWNRISIDVLKRDSGRRLLRRVDIRYTLTCEDASTENWGIRFGAGRLGENGEFSFDFDFGSDAFAIEGAIGFHGATGTAHASAARLTDDQQDSQFCTTGPLTWTADRTGSSPARLTAASVPDGVGFMKVRVNDGVAEIVKRIEP